MSRQQKITAIRDLTVCRLIDPETREPIPCSFILPGEIRKDGFKIKFYAKLIELLPGDIIHAYWGTEYKVISGDYKELLVEEVE